MKKGFVLLGILLCVCACKKPEDKQDSRILSYAVCQMDISTKSNGAKNNMGIVGDSVSVHRLSRWMFHFRDSTVNFGWEKHADAYPLTSVTHEYYFLDVAQPGFYRRDTINHTFGFTNDCIIIWGEHEWPDGINPVGVDGTEYLGYLVCAENVIFEACYPEEDTTKTYIDPFTVTTEEEFMEMRRKIPAMAFDTLGYIPNSQMRANRAHLQTLLNDRKYQEMIDFFKSNYHIYTCTGEEYRELVRLGIN